jgi:hypothetical protein
MHAGGQEVEGTAEILCQTIRRVVPWAESTTL